MNRVWLVATREYRERVTKAPFLISTLMVFVALVSLPLIPIFLGQGRQSGPAKILVVDGSGGEAYHALSEGLSALVEGLVVEPAATAGAAEARVRKGEAAGLLEISGVWPGAVQAEYRATSLLAMEHRSVLQAILTRAAQSQRARQSGLNPALLQAVLAPVPIQGVNLTSGDRSDETEAVRFGLASVAGMLAYVGILASGAMLFQGVLEEKTSRVVEVLAASVRPVQMMAGKIIGLSLLGLTQYASWLLAWVFLITVGYTTLGGAVRMATPAIMAYLLLFTLLGYALYAALFAAAGSLISRMEDSATMMMPVILPLMLPMMLSAMINQNPEGALSRVLSLIPLFTPSVMLSRIVMGGPAPWEILLSVLLLVAAAAGVTWLAGRVYRASLLTYGARPTLAQVWRYLRS